jgi:hypothetical protein
MGKINNSGLSYPEMDRDKCGPFIIKVDHFQNETWQGRIIWAEENRTERFRSTLELIALINEAMGKSQGISELTENKKIL